MNTLKTIPLVAAAAVVAATTIGLTAGAGPASAAPTQTPGTTLVVTPDPANAAYYRLVVKGMFPMNEYDAHGFIKNLETGVTPGGMDYGVFGDDPDSNDRLLGNMYAYRGAATRSTGYLTAESNGIHFYQIISVPKSLLNEDDGADEIYVEADFVDGDGGKRRGFTNSVSGTF